MKMTIDRKVDFKVFSNNTEKPFVLHFDKEEDAIDAAYNLANKEPGNEIVIEKVVEKIVRTVTNKDGEFIEKID